MKKINTIIILILSSVLLSNGQSKEYSKSLQMKFEVGTKFGESGLPTIENGQHRIVDVKFISCIARVPTGQKIVAYFNTWGAEFGHVPLLMSYQATVNDMDVYVASQMVSFPVSTAPKAIYYQRSAPEGEGWIDVYIRGNEIAQK